MNILAASIQNENPDTRLASLQMLAKAAADPHDGGIVVMDAIHHLSAVSKETTRFVTLMNQMKSTSCSAAYRLAGMQLISNVVNFAMDLNMLVYWQMDLERAGVDEVIQVLEVGQDSEILRLTSSYKAGQSHIINQNGATSRLDVLCYFLSDLTTVGAGGPYQSTSRITLQNEMAQRLDSRCALLSDPKHRWCRGSQPKHVSNPA